MNDPDRFICLNCKNDALRLQNGQSVSEKIFNSDLICETCGKTYSFIKGVPRFVPVENYAGSFGYQWNLHRKTQLDSHTGLSISRNRLFGVTGWPEKMEGQLILEAGSGAGRFTEVLCGTGAKIVSFDYSLAVEANFANNGHNENLTLFQGDIYKIPLKKESFDKVLCLGVLQHTPDPEQAFKSLTQYVKPGGELAIDIYAKRLSALLSWKYLLRPVTKRLNQQFLYKIISKTVSILLPSAIFFRKIGGRIGARLLPIVEFSYLGLPYELNREWSVLDTFDMYAPAHDYPHSLKSVNRWFEEAGFSEIIVRNGPNGIVGKGRKPERNTLL